MKGKCFICSIANYEFERRAKVCIFLVVFITFNFLGYILEKGLQASCERRS